jgi:CBS domain containing-hemolysin-like protein
VTATLNQLTNLTESVISAKTVRSGQQQFTAWSFKMDMKHWKVIPQMERYIINRDGEIRNRFTKYIMHPRKDRNTVSLMTDTNKRVCKSPAKLVSQLFGEQKKGA